MQWLVNVTAYTAAGGAASIAVGVALSSLGHLLMPQQMHEIGIVTAIAVAALALARELGGLPIPLPQLHRQTRDLWARSFPGAVAAALWGFDLGLVFTTWLTFSGAWLLLVVAIIIGKAVFGAALFALYWLGRVLMVWLAPLLLQGPNATPQFLERVFRQHRFFQRIHATALAWSLVVLFVWLARSI